MKMFINYLLICSGLALLPKITFAACDPVGTFSINAGAHTVPYGLAVGQAIGGWTVSNSALAYTNCNYDSTLNYNLVTGIKTYNAITPLNYWGAAVFATNLPGIGFAVQGRARFDNNPQTPFTYITANTRQQQIYRSDHLLGERPTITSQAEIILIKTGPITPGIISGPIGYFYAGTRENNSWSTERPITFSGGSIIERGCTVSGNSSFTVSLGTTSNRSFASVGSVRNRQPFTIELRCAAGTKVNMTLTGTAVSTQAGTLLNNGTARGVGVQILNSSGTAVVLNQSFTALNTAQATNTLNFSGQIIRTGNISAGTISASATYTLNYQ